MRLPLRTDLPVHPRAPGRARHLLGEWLRLGGCATEPSDDLVLAVSEAVSNSVEHAYPPGSGGTITIDAIAMGIGYPGTRAVVTVTDTGRWRAAPADVGFRGRGLVMMESLVERLQIEHSSAGTQVRMTSHPCNADR